MADDRADLALITEAVRDAGVIAKRYFHEGVDHWAKHDATPVSQADLHIDTYLKDRLMAARPGYGWLSEETEDDPARLDKPRIFVVDPIDGTRAFLRGKPHFVISIAVVDQGRPVAGVLYEPVHDALFAATKGGGATLNGKAIAPQDRDRLDGAHMIGSEGLYRHPAWPEQWPPLTISTVNSIAYSIGLVAAGLAHGAVALTAKSDWDLAGADLIIHEAGGLLTDHRGAGLVYNAARPRHPTLVAAAPGFHRILLKKLTEFDTAKPSGTR